MFVVFDVIGYFSVCLGPASLFSIRKDRYTSHNRVLGIMFACNGIRVYIYQEKRDLVIMLTVLSTNHIISEFQEDP